MLRVVARLLLREALLERGEVLVPQVLRRLPLQHLQRRALLVALRGQLLDLLHGEAPQGHGQQVVVPVPHLLRRRRHLPVDGLVHGHTVLVVLALVLILAVVHVDVAVLAPGVLVPALLSHLFLEHAQVEFDHVLE